MRGKNLKANIWKLYFIKALRSFMLIIPVIVLFFRENGLTMKEVFLLQSLFSVAVILLEVPTGYFSDIFGRKLSIVIGGSLASLGYGIYSLSHGFWGFLLAEVIIGFGISFISGADSAMLYDTLLEMGKPQEYQKFEGRGTSIGMFSESVASIIGGFLAIVSLRFPLYFDTIITSLVIPLALLLTEPERHCLKNQGSNLENMYRLVKFSLHEHCEIKWLIIYSSITAASTLTMVWFIQAYLVETKVPLVLFGVSWAGFLLVASLFSWNACNIEKFLGRKLSLIMLLVLPAMGYFLISSLWFVWSGIFIVLFYVARGINHPVISSYINGLVSSEIRATVLSVKNLVGRFIFCIIGPLVGWIADAVSLKAALMASGSIFLLLGSISLIFMKKHKAL